MLTGRQQEIWDFLVEYVDRHGYPPTVREIGEQVGLASPSTVHAHLANLERAGYLKRDPTKPRALELTGMRRPADRERAAAAGPPAARRDRRGRAAARGGARGGVRRAAEQLVGGGADFLLRVKGDSMIDAGILSGDIVAVRKTETAKNGDIVVALAGDDESADEATVKRTSARTAASACSPRTRRWNRSTRSTSRSSARSWGLPLAVTIQGLHQTLEQELFALLRGASLECLVCGEFVLHRRDEICCPECGMAVPRERARSASQPQLGRRRGKRTARSTP